MEIPLKAAYARGATVSKPLSEFGQHFQSLVATITDTVAQEGSYGTAVVGKGSAGSQSDPGFCMTVMVYPFGSSGLDKEGGPLLSYFSWISTRHQLFDFYNKSRLVEGYEVRDESLAQKVNAALESVGITCPTKSSSRPLGYLRA